MDDVVFTKGCCVFLSKPRTDDLAEWASWFNDSHITQNLGNHESKFHSPESQLEYWKSEESKGRFFAMARSDSGDLLGVLTCNFLSDNNMSLSIVFPKAIPKSPFAALEATTLFVEYIFREFQVSRISVGQRYPKLKSWSQRLFLIGFQYEGLEKSGYVKNDLSDLIVRMGFTREYFNEIMLQRHGQLWPGDSVIALKWERLNSMLNSKLGARNLTDYFVNSMNETLEIQKTMLVAIQNPL